MRISDRGLAQLAGHEGIVPYPYRDSVGVWTFGIGHTASAGAPDPGRMERGVEQPMSLVLDTFRRDLARFEQRVIQAVKVPLAQHEFDALVSFDFNTGGIFQAKLTAALNRGDRASAAELFMGWSKPAEIIERRRAEQALFRDGRYGGGIANVYRATRDGQVLWGSARPVNVLQLMQLTPAPLPPEKPQPPAAAPRGLAAFLAAIGRAIARLFR